MFDLIHTYILVLLKKIKNKYFVDKIYGAKFYRIIIDSGPPFVVSKNTLRRKKI